MMKIRIRQQLGARAEGKSHNWELEVGSKARATSVSKELELRAKANVCRDIS
jgi:hypothetical protein